MKRKYAQLSLKGVISGDSAVGGGGGGDDDSETNKSQNEGFLCHSFLFYIIV